MYASCVEELLDETKKELHALERHLGFDKEEVGEPEWSVFDEIEAVFFDIFEGYEE